MSGKVKAWACPHVDKDHQSFGLCSSCYIRWFRIRNGDTKTTYLPVPTPDFSRRHVVDPELVRATEATRDLPPRREESPVGPHGLTRRELQAVRAVVAAGSTKMAADALGVATATIRNQLTRAYQKTGSWTGLIGALEALGWLKIPEEV